MPTVFRDNEFVCSTSIQNVFEIGGIKLTFTSNRAELSCIDVQYRKSYVLYCINSMILMD